MTFDELLAVARETARNVADVATEKTEKAVEYSKLKIEQAKLNGELSRLYEELGQACFQAMKCEEDCAETMDILCDEIELVLNDLDDLDELIVEKKNQIYCTECGEKFSKDTKFCPNCGTPVQTAWEAEEVPEQEEVTEAPAEETEE